MTDCRIIEVPGIPFGDCAWRCETCGHERYPEVFTCPSGASRRFSSRSTAARTKAVRSSPSSRTASIRSKVPLGKRAWHSTSSVAAICDCTQDRVRRVWNAAIARGEIITTFSQSKTFKTRKGAEAWLARHGYNPDGSIRSYQPKVWQNPNGTWSHHRDSKREWGDPVACRTDLLFTYEMHPND